jgi:membrane protease YdiL (CAAX protease family)
VSLTTEQLPSVGSADTRARLWTAVAATGICVGGFLVGVLGLFAVRPAAVAAGITETDAYRLLAGNQIQVGMAAFAIVYLAVRDDWEPFVRLRVPTVRDLLWIGGLLVAVALFSPLLHVVTDFLEPFLPAGFGHANTGGETSEPSLAGRPWLWLVAFVGMYGFAAPAEELVYRGLVQGRLRASFDTLGVVLGGGLLFGLLHVLVGIVTPGVGLGGTLYWGFETGLIGLLWGLAYERTENLLVTSVVHAASWTLPLSLLVPF